MPKSDYQRFMDYIRYNRKNLLAGLNARQVFDKFGELWRGIEGREWRQANGVPEPNQKNSRSNSY